VGRFWSILFLTVPVLGVLTFVCAIADIWPMSGGTFAFPRNNWLPANINDHGHVIDSLFTFILYLTAVLFIATAGIRNRRSSRTVTTTWRSFGLSCRRPSCCSLRSTR